MKRFIAMMIVIIMFIAMMSTSVFADSAGSETIATGRCGDNAEWSLYNDGTFVVYGIGEMYDYYLDWDVSAVPRSDVPWEKYMGNITRIIINDGITYVGANAFWGCELLTELSLANSVETIGYSAFESNSLRTLIIPNGTKAIGDFAFLDSPNLEYVQLPESLEYIGGGAFKYARQLKEIHIPQNVNYIGGSAFHENLESIYFYGDVPEECGDNLYKWWAFPDSATVFFQQGKDGWTSPTWKDDNGFTYNTASFEAPKLDSSSAPVWEESRINIESDTTQVYLYYNVDSSAQYVRLDYEGYTAAGEMYESATIGTYPVREKLFAPVDKAYPYSVIKDGDADGCLMGFTEGTISKLYLTVCDASGNSLSERSAAYEVYCAITEKSPELHPYELYVENEYYNSAQKVLYFDSIYYTTEDFGIRNRATGEIVYAAQWAGYQMSLAENPNRAVTFSGTRMSIRKIGGTPVSGYARLQLIEQATGSVVDEITIRSTYIEPEDFSRRPETSEDVITLDSFNEFADEWGLAGEKGITISEKSLSVGVMIFNFEHSRLKNDKPTQYPDGYYVISFDAFNASPIAFEVNAYDSSMCRTNSSALIIKGYTEGFNVWNTVNAMVNGLIDDIQNGKFGFITGEYTSSGKTKTHISIEVPNGGYLKFEEGKPENCNDASWENLANALLRVISIAQSSESSTPIIDAAYDNPMNVSEFSKILKTVGGNELMQELVAKELKNGGAKEVIKTLVEVIGDPNSEIGATLREAVDQYVAELPNKVINAGWGTAESWMMRITGLGGIDALVDMVLAGDDIVYFIDYMWNDYDGLVIHYIAMPNQSP